jgi:hypothetical protein
MGQKSQNNLPLIYTYPRNLFPQPVKTRYRISGIGNVISLYSFPDRHLVSGNPFASFIYSYFFSGKGVVTF